MVVLVLSGTIMWDIVLDFFPSIGRILNEHIKIWTPQSDLLVTGAVLENKHFLVRNNCLIVLRM